MEDNLLPVREGNKMIKQWEIKDKRLVIVFLVIWLIWGAILSDFNPTGYISGEWKTVTHPDYGFSLEYPAKWVIQLYGEEGYRAEADMKVRIMGMGSGFNGIVIYQKYAQNPTVGQTILWQEKLLRAAGDRLSKEGGYVSLSLDEEIVNGVTIFRRTYTMGDNKCQEIYIARANDMITITLQSNEAYFEGYLEDFNRIVSSFTPLH